MITAEMAEQLLYKMLAQKKTYFFCDASQEFAKLWECKEFRDAVKKQAKEYIKNNKLQDWHGCDSESPISFIAEPESIQSFLYKINVDAERVFRVNFLKHIIDNANT